MTDTRTLLLTKARILLWSQKHSAFLLRAFEGVTLGSLAAASLLFAFGHLFIAIPFALLALFLIMTLFAMLEVVLENLKPVQQLANQIDPQMIQDMLNLASQFNLGGKE